MGVHAPRARGREPPALRGVAGGRSCRGRRGDPRCRPPNLRAGRQGGAGRHGSHAPAPPCGRVRGAEHRPRDEQRPRRDVRRRLPGVARRAPVRGGPRDGPPQPPRDQGSDGPCGSLRRALRMVVHVGPAHHVRRRARRGPLARPRLRTPRGAPRRGRGGSDSSRDRARDPRERRARCGPTLRRAGEGGPQRRRLGPDRPARGGGEDA